MLRAVMEKINKLGYCKRRGGNSKKDSKGNARIKAMQWS